jgi:hypothetical protein
MGARRKTMTFHDRHVGELEVRLEFSKIRGCVPAGTDTARLLAGLRGDLEAVFKKHFADHELVWGEEFAQFECGFEPELIKTREEAAAAWEETRRVLGECWAAADERRQERLAANPDNGKLGWWQVEGVRHDALVEASSAAEAVTKAIAAGKVGDWEAPEADYIGEELPEVV